MVTFSMLNFNDNSLDNAQETENALLECEICGYKRMHVLDVNLNSVGQMITKFECPECGNIETICEIGKSKRINREGT